MWRRACRHDENGAGVWGGGHFTAAYNRTCPSVGGGEQGGAKTVARREEGKWFPAASHERTCSASARTPAPMRQRWGGSSKGDSSAPAAPPVRRTRGRRRRGARRCDGSGAAGGGATAHSLQKKSAHDRRSAAARPSLQQRRIAGGSHAPATQPPTRAPLIWRRRPRRRNSGVAGMALLYLPRRCQDGSAAVCGGAHADTMVAAQGGVGRRRTRRYGRAHVLATRWRRARRCNGDGAEVPLPRLIRRRARGRPPVGGGAHAEARAATRERLLKKKRKKKGRTEKAGGKAVPC